MTAMDSFKAAWGHVPLLIFTCLRAVQRRQHAEHYWRFIESLGSIVLVNLDSLWRAVQHWRSSAIGYAALPVLPMCAARI